VASQVEGAQSLTGTPRLAQAPAPSQVSATWTLLPAAQVVALQWVPAGQSWQAPLPSQSPLVPQLVAGCCVQVPVGSAPPAGTFVQVPS